MRSAAKWLPGSDDPAGYAHVLAQSVGIAVTDPAGNILHSNAVFSDLTGFTEMELKHCTLQQLLQLPDTAFNGKPWKGDADGRSKTGAIFSADASITPISDPRGKIDRYLFVAADITRHRQHEEKKLLYEQIILTTDDGIISKNLDGIITSWNHGAEKILGYTSQETVGRHISMLIPPERLDEEPTIIENAKAGKRIAHFETERLRKDGTKVQVSLCLSPIKDTNGNIVGVSKILRDITRQKADEDKLRESEIKYRSFFDDSPLPMWVLEKETRRFLDVNETAIREYGYSREEFLSMTAYDIRSDDEKSRLAKLVRTGDEGTRSAGIWQHLRKNGTEILCEISVHGIHYNHTDALLVMCNNVTEREKIRRQVIESEQRFRNTLDTMLEGVQIIDFDYRYQYVNDVMARHGRLPREAFAGKKVMEMFPAIEQTDLFRAYQQCFAERVPIHLETFIRYPDGSTGWFELLFQPIPEGLFVLSIDITERKQATEKLLNSEKIYRAIASSIPGSVICIIDKDRRYRLIEGDMLEKFGYRKNELMNRTVAECVPAERYAEVEPSLEKAFNGEIISVEDVRPSYYTISKFVPLPDATGNIEAVMIAVLDITELKSRNSGLKI